MPARTRRRPSDGPVGSSCSCGSWRRVALLKGLYHWATVCGLGSASPSVFEQAEIPYQTATVFFAVIDLVAAVGLWLAAPWGAVVWLTSVISMAAVEALFPKSMAAACGSLRSSLDCWPSILILALLSAREQTP